MKAVFLAVWGALAVPSGAVGQVLLYEIVGSQPNVQFGSFVSGLGDLDDDGHDDFGITAPGMNGGARQVRIYSGANGSVLHEWNGPLGVAPLTIRPAGDVNGDGLEDLILQGDILVAPNWTPLWGVSPTSFTVVMLAAGDVGADGNDDILWGAPTSSVGGLYLNGSGRILSGPTGNTLYAYAGAQDYDKFGWPAALGDVDGDGFADFAFGATQLIQALYTGPMPGYIKVYSGATGGEIHHIAGPGSGFFGNILVGAGDVDDDGVPDLVAGAGGGFAWFRTIERVLVYSLASGSMLYEIVGSRGPLAAPGDVNGDGYADFLVSRTPLAGLRLHSGPNGDLLALVTPPGGLATMFSGAGDVNADDFPDFIVGNPSLNRAFVYSGAPPGVTSFGLGCPGPSGVVPR